MKKIDIKKLIANIGYVESYKRMWPFIKPYWFRALIAVLICFPIGTLDGVIAFSLKPYMDIVMIGGKKMQSPWYIPFLIVGFMSFQGILSYIATYINTWVGMKITNDVKKTLFRKLLSLETSFFDRQTSGDIIFRFHNDADIACSGLLNNLKTFISRIVSSVSLVGVMIYNSWELAIIGIIVFVCALIPLSKVKSVIKAVFERSAIVGSMTMTAFNELFAGNRTIAAYNLAKKQDRRLEEILDEVFRLNIKITQRTGWLTPMMHIIVSIGVSIIIGLGSYLIVNGKITSGNFVSFLTALIMLYTPVKRLGGTIKDVQTSLMAIERVSGLLDLKPQICDKADSKELVEISGDIKFNNVHFEYIPNSPVLKGVNLDIKVGETVALVGNSGGGKSTIVSLLPRFYEIQQGMITIDGVDIRDLTIKSLRDKIAVVFQDNFLFSGTIRENIMLGKENATEEELRVAIQSAFLDEFVASLQNGVDTYIGERGILLSGGQKQRVAIARAFLKNAPIVILDEATSALDNKAEAIVQRAIDNLMAHKTVLVIAHRLSTVQNADKIVVIENGQIEEIGNHENLLSRNGAYSALYNAQFKNRETISV